jgi:hypothetical protein
MHQKPYNFILALKRNVTLYDIKENNMTYITLDLKSSYINKHASLCYFKH